MKYKSLEITDEEKDNLKRYCEYEHRYINLLTSGDFQTINKLDDKVINIFSKEYFEKVMNVLTNVYSAMIKYSYNRNGEMSLYRGTTVAEMRNFKSEYTKLLSTSTDELSAKWHAGSKVMNRFEDEDDKKAVLMRINTAKDVPFINVNDVLKDDENNHNSEREIILAPFEKIQKVEHAYSDKGYRYYNVSIEH